MLNWYKEGRAEQIDLDCSVKSYDDDGNEYTAINLFLDNGTINVTWVEVDSGADCVSNLTDEHKTLIWELIKSIKQ